MKKYLTVEQAISLLPEGETVHTFYGGVALIGADWEREEVVNYHAPKGTWLPASTTTAQVTN